MTDAQSSTADEATLAAKEARLHARLEEFESLLIAYSGGVDSAYPRLGGLARASAIACSA